MLDIDFVDQDAGECPPDLTLCGGLCIDLQADHANCGSCGRECPSAEVCSNGDCALECPSGVTDCDGSCVDIDSNIGNCGGCGIACLAGDHATAVCEMGVCAVDCEEGWSDPDGNGSCDVNCDPSSMTETCNGIDDNCNGDIDEGFPCRMGGEVGCTTSCGSTGRGICGLSCQVPTLTECTPPAEACNGTDDDCDGTCDNGFGCCRGSSGSCTTSCGTTGTRTCDSSCAWSSCSPPAEACNGADDDCDGTCDDGFDCCGGSSGSCTTSCGSTGTRTCSSTCSWGSCLPVCSGHGTCTAGSCVCNEGYAGTNCDSCARLYIGYPSCVADPPTGTCGCHSEPKDDYGICGNNICRDDPGNYSCGGCGGAANRCCTCRSCAVYMPLPLECTEAACKCTEDTGSCPPY